MKIFYNRNTILQVICRIILIKKEKGPQFLYPKLQKKEKKIDNH